MTNPPTDLIARLDAAAKQAIAKALAKRKSPTEATLADIERCARDAGQAIEQAIAAVLAEESAAQPVEAPPCPRCKKK